MSGWNPGNNQSECGEHSHFKMENILVWSSKKIEFCDYKQNIRWISFCFFQKKLTNVDGKIKKNAFYCKIKIGFELPVHKNS